MTFCREATHIPATSDSTQDVYTASEGVEKALILADTLDIEKVTFGECARTIEAHCLCVITTIVQPFIW